MSNLMNVLTNMEQRRGKVYYENSNKATSRYITTEYTVPVLLHVMPGVQHDKTATWMLGQQTSSTRYFRFSLLARGKSK